jgi:hypothetical protein
VDQGQIQLEDLLGRLSGRALEVRLALDVTPSGQVLRALVGDLLPNGKVRRSSHDYGDIRFVIDQVGGDDIIGWLKTRIGTAGGHAFQLPEFHTGVNFQRQPAFGQWDPAPLPLPVTRYELSLLQPDQRGQRAGFLVAQDNSQSFMDYERAALHFLWELPPDVERSALPSSPCVLRIASTEAWIAEVGISATSLKVRLAGKERDGARLELLGPGLHQSRTAGRSGRRLLFQLPRGLPRNALVLLTRGGRWLDYRHLGWGYPQAGEQGITVEDGDPAAELQSLIFQGEGTSIEFKRKLPETRHEKHNVLKTVAAFAAGEGGTLILGVGEKGQSDEGEVVGLSDISGSREMLIDMVRRQVVPEPALRLVVSELSAKAVIALVVGPGGRPHAVYPDKPEFYVRRHATTFPARYEEIERSIANSVRAEHGPSGLGPRLTL